MNADRWLLATVFLLAAFAVGCNSVRLQFRQAVEDMKADAAMLDSDDDDLDAFGSADARHLRAAREEMER